MFHFLCLKQWKNDKLYLVSTTLAFTKTIIIQFYDLVLSVVSEPLFQFSSQKTTLAQGD